MVAESLHTDGGGVGVQHRVLRADGGGAADAVRRERRHRDVHDSQWHLQRNARLSLGPYQCALRLRTSLAVRSDYRYRMVHALVRGAAYRLYDGYLLLHPDDA